MKTLLILAINFPPKQGVGIIRTAKFCKLMPLHGWKPLVFTVDPRYYNAISENNYESELEQVEIRRIPYIHLPKNKFLIKLFYPFIAAVFAFRHRKKVDAVYMSGSPYYPFPLTVFLSSLLGIPSVLDFRDSWSINHGYDGREKTGWLSALRTFVYCRIEKFSIHHASKVIFATSVLQQEYTALFPDLSHKYLTITNGIDLDDFANVQPVRVSPNRTIVMAGKFRIYIGDATLDFLKCLKSFPDIHFLYIGEESQSILHDAVTAGVENQVTALPFQPYNKVVQLIAGSDAAILSNGLVNGMGTKIFDYFALNKPVLCLVPEHSIITREFGNESSVVISEAPHTYEKINRSIEKLLAISNSPPVSTDSFTRQSSARKLSETLNCITQNNR